MRAGTGHSGGAGDGVMGCGAGTGAASEKRGGERMRQVGGAPRSEGVLAKEGLSTANGSLQAGGRMHRLWWLGDGVGGTFG